MKQLQDLFVPYDLAVKIKDKGFKGETLAKYSDFLYPLNDSGDDFAKCKCLYIPLENRFDEIRMLWIEKENGHFHWHEGTYVDGEHSRCELTGDDINAPTFEQIINWLDGTHKIRVDLTHSNSNGAYKYTIWKWNFDNSAGNWEKVDYINSFVDKNERNSKAIEASLKLI